jgi:hypothetical protein
MDLFCCVICHLMQFNSASMSSYGLVIEWPYAFTKHQFFVQSFNYFVLFYSDASLFLIHDEIRTICVLCSWFRDCCPSPIHIM